MGDEAKPERARALALRVQRRRHELSLTQNQVAERSGIDLKTLQLIEAGQNGFGKAQTGPANPKLNTLVDLAFGLDWVVEDLVKDLV